MYGVGSRTVQQVYGRCTVSVYIQQCTAGVRQCTVPNGTLCIGSRRPVYVPYGTLCIGCNTPEYGTLRYLIYRTKYNRGVTEVIRRRSRKYTEDVV